MVTVVDDLQQGDTGERTVEDEKNSHKRLESLSSSANQTKYYRSSRIAHELAIRKAAFTLQADYVHILAGCNAKVVASHTPTGGDGGNRQFECLGNVNS